MDNHTIKANIRAIRESKGLTQEQMALRLGMNRQSYWTLENGKTQLVSERLFDIANALNTPDENALTVIPYGEKRAGWGSLKALGTLN